MSILSWDKPGKIMTEDEWRSIAADGAPPGVYTPNMSAEDAARWKAKIIGSHGDHPRVEIRKSARGVQLLIVVCEDEVAMSMNGTAKLTLTDYTDMLQAVVEARVELAARSEAREENR